MHGDVLFELLHLLAGYTVLELGLDLYGSLLVFLLIFSVFVALRLFFSGSGSLERFLGERPDPALLVVDALEELAEALL
jgi:hypothetical protein